MGSREIPATFEHTCDSCGASKTTKAQTRPSYWSNLTIGRDAYDYHGIAVADGTIKRLLCDGCSDKATKALNQIATEAREALSSTASSITSKKETSNG